MSWSDEPCSGRQTLLATCSETCLRNRPTTRIRELENSKDKHVVAGINGFDERDYTGLTFSAHGPF